MDKRIMITGASGLGKTTVAKWISEEYNIPYISGSLHNIWTDAAGKAPLRLNQSHADNIATIDRERLHYKNMRTIGLREKLFSKTQGSFVTDRSFLDAVVYEIYENSFRLKECDTQAILDLANKAFYSAGITHLIYIPYTQEIHLKWPSIEDDGRRITNKYFQMMVSGIFSNLIFLHMTNNNYLVNSCHEGITHLRTIPYLELYPDTIEHREEMIRSWLKN